MQVRPSSSEWEAINVHSSHFYAEYPKYLVVPATILKYVEFRDGLERHELRYHPLNFGLLYKGKADHQEFLEEWSQRVASNLAGHSLGVYHIRKEGEPCM